MDFNLIPQPSSRRFVSSPPAGYVKYATGYSLIDGSYFDSYQNDLGDRVSVKRKTEPKKKRGKVGWREHCRTHWSMDIGEHRLDYYPTKGTVRFKGETYRKVPCIKKFIQEHSE